MYVGDDYKWDAKVNVQHTTLFSCNAQWTKGKQRHFDAFTASRDEERCQKYHNSCLWSTIWYTRNCVVHDGIVASVPETFIFVETFLKEWDSACLVSCPVTPSELVYWQAPTGSIVKFNFDLAFSSHIRTTTSGVVGRNSSGLIMAACSDFYSHVGDVCIAEDLACKQAVLFARDLGFSSVIIEGDSLTVIKKLNASSFDRSIISPIVYDIKDVVRSFDSISFRFVRRDANNAAHVLAYECQSPTRPSLLD
ncbi:hypothetical protein V6N13_122705 [Hibiscus sabdariffa]|uniref:RNase H type-1 domain-containing protein n=1 Tax=Hibiscus sabdariffa TaxID=183260 RepID=A0ABR2P409_9ROSI